MRRPSATPALLSLGLVLALAQCDGCREECAVQGLRAEGCGCERDTDCTTVGELLMCVDGTCAPGDPPDAEGDTPCDVDRDCGGGAACAADGTCQPAAACQRLEPNGPLTARSLAVGGEQVLSTATVAAADVEGAPRDDCGLAITVETPGVEAIGWFALDGALTDATCEGRWFAAYRAGFLICGGALVALSPDGVTTCVGDDCDGRCTSLGDGDIGVCP